MTWYLHPNRHQSSNERKAKYDYVKKELKLPSSWCRSMRDWNWASIQNLANRLFENGQITK